MRLAFGKKYRNKHGQAVALPMIMLALMVVIVVGLFSFELARMAVAREQLRTATEAAALAGAATMAGSPSSDITLSQSNAIAAAKAMFRQNEIFGQSLINAEEGNGVPSAGQTFLSFQFLDPQNNNAPVAPGDPKGKALELKALYGLPGFAGKVIGLGDSTLPLEAKATGGVGELDVVFCYDCSSSMRFHTFTTSVRRAWNPNQAKIDYTEVNHSNFSPSGGMRPQLINNLNAALRGQNDNSLPGNFPPGNASVSGLTDQVVNFDEQANFGGFSDGDFNFPNIASLVEASRGNLENDAVFAASGADTTLRGLVTPKAGYQAKYFELARKHTHPWAEAEAAAKDFFTLMKNNTRAHFGLVAFTQQVGQNENTSFNDFKVGASYQQGGSQAFPLPAISLKPAESENNADAVSAAVSTLVPDGNTNIGGSIERANRMFDNNASRPNAKRAIVLFTDGIPSVGQPLSGDPTQNCSLAAQQARQRGIAIFAVGLALEPSEMQTQRSVLNMITSTAGNGGRFFQVSNASNLKQAFAAIARNLTQIVQ
ncbi:MAG: VWA domain-containing protein [Candidatus Obscuribacterales bacterium]|nr:VWA domain-containing protein [Candidatus Obscuribacterales bacterium]